MKTTIELPDELFQRVKSIALRRRTTMKALITRALEREIRSFSSKESSIFRVDEDGVPYLPSRGASVTSEHVAEILENEEG